MVKTRNYKFIVVVITVGQAQLFTNQLVDLEIMFVTTTTLSKDDETINLISKEVPSISIGGIRRNKHYEKVY